MESTHNSLSHQEDIPPQDDGVDTSTRHHGRRQSRTIDSDQSQQSIPSNKRGRGGGRGGGHRQPPRLVEVSKSFSRLLRHAAVQERVPIDSRGYTKCDDLLKWHKCKSLKVDMDEVIEVVRTNEKKRFALLYVPDQGSIVEKKEELQIVALAGIESSISPADGDQVVDTSSTTPITTMTEMAASSESKSTTSNEFDEQTLLAFQNYNTDKSPAHYFIRASQGHSMDIVETEELLSPITLDDPNSIPETVVHGTFHGSWAKILESGGLKRMQRNHVHFAKGPALREFLDDVGPDQSNKDGASQKTSPQQSEEKSRTTTETKSGPEQTKSRGAMKHLKPILIYVDIRKALEEEPGMTWWMSANGVVLTEGISGSDDRGFYNDMEKEVVIDTRRVDTDETNEENDVDEQNEEKEDVLININDPIPSKSESKHSAQYPSSSPQVKSKSSHIPPTTSSRIVPLKYVTHVIEVKEGIGLLYTNDKGVVKELPKHLKEMKIPIGKDRGEKEAEKSGGNVKRSGGKGMGRGGGYKS